MPPADVRHESDGLGRTPGARFVVMDGRHRAQDGLNDRPRRLHTVLTREQRAIPDHRVAQETLVGVHLIPPGMADDCEFRRIANQLFTGTLHAGADGAIVTSGLSRKRT